MASSFPIPLVTLQPGVIEFGPANARDNESTIVLTIDRTVTGGLNQLPATSTVAVDVMQSDDGGASWFLAVGGVFPGGVFTNPKTGLTIGASTLRVDLYPGTSRKLKAAVTTSGTPVAVAGTLVTS